MRIGKKQNKKLLFIYLFLVSIMIINLFVVLQTKKACVHIHKRKCITKNGIEICENDIIFKK